jgi:hypothetical protein
MTAGAPLALGNAEPGTAATRPAPAADILSSRLLVAVFVLAASLTALVLMHLGRRLTFFYDEWQFIQYRRHGLLEPFLEPHNGHLSAVPVAAYRILFATVGLHSYTVYRSVVILLHVACATMVFVYGRRRVPPTVALVVAIASLWLGRAWQDLLWPFQIGFLTSVAAGIATFHLLDRDTRASAALASLAVAFALASSGIGVPVLVGTGINLVWQRAWRRLWIVGVPGVLYLGWYGAFGEARTDPENLVHLPRYIFDAAAGAAGSVAGLPLGTEARWLALGLLGLLTFAVWRYGLSANAAGLCGVLLSFWTLTALTRGANPDPAASRYLYPGGVFLLLVTLDLLARVRIRRPVVLAMAACLLVAGWSNAGALRDGAAGLRDTSEHVRAGLLAVELGTGMVAPGFQPDPNRMPQVQAGPYLAAARELGSPAPKVDALGRQPAAVRSTADAVLNRILAGTRHWLSTTLGLNPDHCRAQQASTVRLGVDFAVPTGVIALETLSQTEVRVRRFSGQFTGAPVATIPRGQHVAIRLPSPTAEMPWHLELRASEPVRICADRS